MGKKLWIVSELFFPELASTGYIITEIARGLANYFDVNVICAQPTYHSRGQKSKAVEILDKVKINRCWSTTFNKDNLVGRFFNLFTICVTVFINSLFKFRKGDNALVVTNPPALPLFIVLASKFKGVNSSIIVHDIYPDLLEATGKIKKGFLFNIFSRINRFTLLNMDNIYVIGRDMKDRLVSQYGIAENKIIFSPNWADIYDVYPDIKAGFSFREKYKLENKFIILYAGNIGYPNDIETIIYAAKILKNDNFVHFIFIGAGSKKRKLISLIRQNKITNITILPLMPRDRQKEFLNGSDICLVSLVKGMKGISVPSRTYNIMAAGKPIIAIMEKGSEVARIIDEEGIGWLVDPGDYENLAKVIIEARDNEEKRLLMGNKARRVAEEKYSYGRILNIFIEHLIS